MLDRAWHQLMALGTAEGASSILGRSMTIELRALMPDVRRYVLDGVPALLDLVPWPDVSALDK